MGDDERVAEILGEWYAQRQEGRAPPAEEILARHSDLAGQLRDGMAAFDFLHIALTSAPGDLAAAPEGTPNEIGDFVIRREIGRGGMGVVYEAEQKSMRRKVALKVLSLAFASAPHAVKRFEREAQAAGKLHHTNIVPIYGMGQFAGYWYYAMELVEGRSLSRVIAELRAADAHPTEESLACMTPAHDPPSGTGTGARSYFVRVAELFAGVADALHLAHHEGIVHRDIKPSNLLLDAEGTLKVVDFGLALQADAGGPSMTVTGDLLGTPAYMSPEQAMAKRIRVDHRTDCYSLGATLYEVLTLAPPFEGGNLAELCSQIITKDPAAPRRRNRRIPRDLETIVLKAMEKDRDKRYQNAAEFARDLRRFAEGSAIHARRIGPVGRTWRKVKRHKARSALVAALVLVAVGGGMLGFRAAAEAEQRRTLQYERLLARGNALFGRSLFQPARANLTASQPTGADAPGLFTRAIEVIPDRPEAYWHRALAPGGTVAERLRDADAAGDRGLPAAERHLLRAYVYRAGGRRGEAAAERALAGPKLPSSPAGLYLRAFLLEREGEREQALRLFSRVLDEMEPSRAVRLLAHSRRGTLRLRCRDYAGALDDLQAVSSLGCDLPIVRVRIASVWRRLGEEEVAAKRFARAREEARVNATEEGWLRLCRACQVADEHGWRAMAAAAAIEALGENAKFLHAWADSLRRLGERDAALAKIDRAIEIDPGDARHTMCRGMILHDCFRQPEEALAFFDRAIEMDDGYALAYVNRGVALMSEARYQDALEALNVALSLDPNQAHAHFVRAAALSKLDRPDDALAAYGQTLLVDPWHTGAQINRGRTLENLGRPEEALAAYEEAIAIDPALIVAHHNRAGQLIRLDRLQDALRAAEEGLAIAPGDTAEMIYEDPSVSETTVRVGLHLMRGRALALLGRYEKALAAVDDALDLRPDDALSHWNRGIYLEKLGAFDKALAAYARFTELRPDVADGYYRQGFAHTALGQFEGAVEAFRRCLDLDPKRVGARLGRAQALANVGEYLAALEDAKRAEQLGMRGPHVTYVQAYALRMLGELDEALAHFERCGKYPPALKDMAWLLATTPDEDRRDPTRAVELARQALALAAGNEGDFLVTLGVALSAAQRWQEARAVLERSMDLRDGGDSSEWFVLAVVYAHLERPDEAVRWHDQAVAWMEKNKPVDPDLERLRAEAKAALGIKRE